MPRISGIVTVDYPHHVAQRGVRSVDIFHEDEDQRQYWQFIKEKAVRSEVDILA